MISYSKFKEIFDKINYHTEIEFFFNNKRNTYMIIKYEDYITFQRCGIKEEQSGEIKFVSLDELYNRQTIDGIVLKEEWNNIKDILFDCTFSIIEDRAVISNLYGIKL